MLNCPKHTPWTYAINMPNQKERELGWRHAITTAKWLHNCNLSNTWPALRRRRRSQSIIVFKRWAIMSIVQDLNSSLIVFWISASVLTSTAAVASSRTRIFDLRSNARARLSSCLCPTLKFSPASETLGNWKVKELSQFLMYS